MIIQRGYMDRRNLIRNTSLEDTDDDLKLIKKRKKFKRKKHKGELKTTEYKDERKNNLLKEIKYKENHLKKLPKHTSEEALDEIYSMIDELWEKYESL